METGKRESKENEHAAFEAAKAILVRDGICSRVVVLLSGGAFLAAMALALGASNYVIGLLAAIGPVSQMLQIPAIFLVEKWRARKPLTILFAVSGRAFLIVIALTPLILPESAQLPVFIVSLIIFYSFGAISGCAFSSWIRDLIPENIIGSFLGSRLSVATAIGAAITVAGAFSIDSLKILMDSEVAPYSVIFALAGVIGLWGSLSLFKVEEPPMAPAEGEFDFFGLLFKPLRDENFRRLLYFSATWNFAIIMGGAFFAVYMLKRVGISLTWVILLAVVSQLTNIYFFRLWGGLSDRFSNKSVLKVVSPLFLLAMALYPFTTLPEAYWLSLPLLVLIHIVGGISTAGFTLCANNIALKLAPRGEATSYLAANAFFSGLGATFGPLVGGLIGGYFEFKRLSLELFWHSDIRIGGHSWDVPTFDLQGLDFVFIAAVIAGIVSLFLLAKVHEEGTVDEKLVREEAYNSVRQTFVSLSNVAGMRRMTYFPYELARKTAHGAAKKTAAGMSRMRRSEFE